MPSRGMSYAELVAQGELAQQRLAEVLAEAQSARAEHRRQVVHLRQLRQAFVTLRQQRLDTLGRSELLCREVPPVPEPSHPLVAAIPEANAMVREIAYVLFAARGLLTEAEAKGSTTAPPATCAPQLSPRQP